MVTIYSDESLDLLFGERIALIQARRGYRTCIDSLALAWCGSQIASVTARSALDLGCGTGLVALAIARALPHTHWTLLDFQAQQLDRAQRSLALNGLSERAQLVAHDLARSVDLPQFDLIVCNPPFRNAATEQAPADPERRLAHFESTARLDMFILRISQLLAPSGRAALIYPWRHHQRAIAGAEAIGLHTSLCSVLHCAARHAPMRCLLALQHDANVTVKTGIPLALHLHPNQAPDSTYSADLETFFDQIGPLGQARGVHTLTTLSPATAQKGGKFAGPPVQC